MRNSTPRHPFHGTFSQNIASPFFSEVNQTGHHEQVACQGETIAGLRRCEVKLTTAFFCSDMDDRLDAIFGQEEEGGIVTPDQLGLSVEELSALLVTDEQQINRRGFLKTMAAGTGAVAALPLLASEANAEKRPGSRSQRESAKEKAEKTPEERLAESLTYVDDVYTNQLWKQYREAYLSVLKKKDVDSWKKMVEKEKAQKSRVSFPAEFTAYGKVFTAKPVEGLSAEPVESEKYGVDILGFSPDKYVSTGKPLPEEYRDRKYLLIRGHVPRENNPYCVLVARYLKDATAQQVRALVEDYRRKW